MPRSKTEVEIAHKQADDIYDLISEFNRDRSWLEKQAPEALKKESAQRPLPFETLPKSGFNSVLFGHEVTKFEVGTPNFLIKGPVDMDPIRLHYLGQLRFPKDIGEEHVETLLQFKSLWDKLGGLTAYVPPSLSTKAYLVTLNPDPLESFVNAEPIDVSFSGLSSAGTISAKSIISRSTIFRGGRTRA
jgi:hypothetical protein